MGTTPLTLRRDDWEAARADCGGELVATRPGYEAMAVEPPLSEHGCNEFTIQMRSLLPEMPAP